MPTPGERASRTPLIQRDHVVVPLDVATLPDALARLVEQLARSGHIRDQAALEEGLASNLDRAAVVITHDVVLPHLRTDAVSDLNVALGVTTEPVPVGDQSARIVALVLAPTEATTIYLRTVAALARVLRQDAVIDRLLTARAGAEVLEIPELAALSVQTPLSVGDIMTRDLAPISPAMPVRDVVARLAQSGLRALPVVGDKGEVLGLVSEADVLRGMIEGATREKEPETHRFVPPLTARDVMTRSVLCIAEATELEEAARIMLSKDLDLFPVVTEGRLSGLISRGDILRQLYGR